MSDSFEQNPTQLLCGNDTSDQMEADDPMSDQIEAQGAKLPSNPPPPSSSPALRMSRPSRVSVKKLPSAPNLPNASSDVIHTGKGPEQSDGGSSGSEPSGFGDVRLQDSPDLKQEIFAIRRNLPS